jgi:uncharacterized membrane protein YbhN (UPF0104 family)
MPRLLRIRESIDHTRASSIDDLTISTQSRRLRNGLISLAVFFALVAALLLAVPGLRAAGERITDANIALIALGIVFELLSCAGYVVLFMLVFQLGRRFATRLSLAELAVNSVVSVSGAAGIALGAWVLRTRGVAVERIARRSVLLFVLTSAVNVIAVAAIGLAMWLGLVPGSTDPLLTLLPAAVALGAIVGTLALAAWARSRVAEGHESVAWSALGCGVGDAVGLLRRGEWRLVGALGYWLFDVAVLAVCLAAYGSTPAFWIVAMAYLIGLFANSLPIPGGLFAVEGGLVGMLVLFGVRPASTVVAAVLTYRAIALWIPSIVGSLAFLSIRREIGEPMAEQTARV